MHKATLFKISSHNTIVYYTILNISVLSIIQFLSIIRNVPIFKNIIPRTTSVPVNTIYHLLSRLQCWWWRREYHPQRCPSPTPRLVRKPRQCTVQTPTHPAKVPSRVLWIIKKVWRKYTKKHHNTDLARHVLHTREPVTTAGFQTQNIPKRWTQPGV